LALFLLGGITIAWVNEGNDGNPCVLHIQPFTAKDFATRSLSDRIRDFDDLITLFPSKNKSEAFDKYTTPSGQPKNKDYIPSEIRAILSTSNNPNNSMNSYANTPHSFMQSPDHRDTPSVQR
jgi:signal transducer and activator of transcription 5B